MLVFVEKCKNILYKLFKYNKHTYCQWGNIATGNDWCYDTSKQSNINGKEMNIMYTVFDIANWFLSKGRMDHKKLQKLCYYAQAWSWTLKNKPLFTGAFEAWVHGPVNRTLWNSLRDYGYVDVDCSEFNNRTKTICNEDSAFLERIWATYGEFNGCQLENLTHTELPWIKARRDLPPTAPSNYLIDVQDMKSYYSALISADGVGE